MISVELRNTFQALETLAFLEWRNADKKKRNQITKQLGKIEGEMIINEISEQVKNI